MQLQQAHHWQLQPSVLSDMQLQQPQHVRYQRGQSSEGLVTPTSKEPALQLTNWQAAAANTAPAFIEQQGGQLMSHPSHFRGL